MPSFLSLLNISLETANKFYSWGWKASLFGALITLIGVSLLMLGTRVRDQDFEAQIANLNSSAATANENAAKLEKETELLKKENLETKLVLEKLKAQRTITAEMRKKFFSNLKKFAGTDFILAASNNESIIFAKEIGDVLVENGWNRINWPDSGTAWNLRSITYLIGNVETTGVDIHIFDSSLSEARDALFKALTDAKFEKISSEHRKDIPPEHPQRKSMIIYVGSKI